MTLSLVVLGLFASLLLAAAIFDLLSYTIPNRLTGTLLALFVIFVLVSAARGHAMSWRDLQLHLLAGAMALAVTIVMFARGWIGGGDAKLFAVVCLWIGWHEMLDYAVIASLLGGMLTMSILALRAVPLPAMLAVQPWIMRLAEGGGGVPYGVALGLAALRILPNTELFRLAIG